MNIAGFRKALIDGIYGRIYERITDNYDYSHFSRDGVDRSNQINAMRNAQYFDYVLENIGSFYATHTLFSAETSRQLYMQIILFRCLGHPHLRIKENKTWSTVNGLFNDVKHFDVGPSRFKFDDLMFGELRHYEKIPVEAGTVSLDCWPGNAVYGLLDDGAGSRQYYYQHQGIRVSPEPGDYVLDCGACFGDTAIFFSHSVGPGGRVFAFDPLPRHVEVATFNIEQNGFIDRAAIIPCGIGAESNHILLANAAFSETTNPGFSMQNVQDLFPMVAIDDFVETRSLAKVDFIKMDIEGFELDGLRGADLTIRKHRPRLAISLYHKWEDLYAIPLYLKEKYPFYKFYLDHHTIHADETVLYVTA